MECQLDQDFIQKLEDKGWQAVIGLEMHAQLATKSKLFSPAANRFGAEPNTNIHPICLGLPGTLPKLNKEAVRMAVMLGCALGSKIAPRSRFDRKSYFYPDSPRNFQITQFYEPIITGGSVTDEESGLQFAIDRAHLEDDAGMLKHFHGWAGVDYNRAGAPLIEVVSMPCMHSPYAARRYVTALREVLLYLGVSHANMERGEIRIDVNISVRKIGEQTLRPKAEIKNMNSISNMESALHSEISRQIALYEQHPDKSPEEVMPQTTFRYDPDRKETIRMRTKESAADYRYFPEPDLPAILIDAPFIERISATLPELAREKKQRYKSTLHLSDYQIQTLLDDLSICRFFEKALKQICSPEKLASSLVNWITVEFLGRVNEKQLSLEESGVKPGHVAQLVNMIDHGDITGKIAKKIADEMVASPEKSPEQIIESNPNYRPVDNKEQIETWVQEVLDANPSAVTDYKGGKNKAYGFLVGQVMAKSRGAAHPETVNKLLKERLS